MASRRFRARKTLSKSIDRIEKRMRYVEKRTAKTRLTPRVVTTEKLYAKTVTTAKIADNAVTTQVIAPGAVTTTQIDFNAGDIGGSTSYVQTGAPSNPNLGDIWFDSDNDNELKQWNGSAWVSVRDATIAIAQSAANAAQSTADGKNKIFRQGTTPTGTFAVGDLWFDTANDNRISRWNGSTWEQYGLGNAAIANLDAGKITAGSISADRIAANSLNANKIVSGTITGTQIAADAIDGKVITGATVRTANSPTRVEMNSSGLFVYNSGSPVVSLNSNGTASFNGSVTASSFTATGLVDNGDLEDRTITSGKIALYEITADEIQGGTITAAEIAAKTITADEITAGTITADELAANSITASKISAGAVTATKLSATAIDGKTITGALVRTSSASARVELADSSDSLRVITGGVTRGHVVGATAGSGAGIIMHYGSTVNAGATTYGLVYLASNYAILAADSNNYFEASSSINTISGSSYFITSIYNQNPSTTTGAANTNTTTGGLIRTSTASSREYKENIVDLTTVLDLDPYKLLSIPVRAFRYKSAYLNSEDPRAGMMIPGFIAEEVEEIYPAAVDRKEDGSAESWNDRFIVPGMLKLIQDMDARLTTLEGAR